MKGDGRLRRRLTALLLAGVLAASAGWARWHYPLPDPDARGGPTVRLYAGTEELAAFQGFSHRSQIWVPLARVPRPVMDAVVSAEDRRFFRHWGIDLLAVLRAAVTDLRHREVRQGGSTITQQLARTLFLSSERTWARKLRESAIALLIEFRYPKDRILEAYLNTIYLGHDGDIAVHGLGAAARHFLGKDLTAVHLDEAALLAAAISAPNRILSTDSARALAARNGVLLAMRNQGRISERSLGSAMAKPVKLRIAGTAARAPYFVGVAREELSRRLTLPSAGEVKIPTSLDPILQRAAERAIQDGVRRIERRQTGAGSGRLQAALVAIEPATGQIRALVGGRRYLDAPFNRATQAARQPGSLFKPVVYLAAFETERSGDPPRLTPASLLWDEPTEIRVGDLRWSPRNLDRRFRGPVTVRRAVEESLNIPTVRVAQEVGLDRVIQVARDVGIESPLHAVPSLALGTSEVTLLEITGAYATLANHGVRMAPTTLALDSGGVGASILDPLPQPERVVSAESTFLVTHLLRGVMQHGTGRDSVRWGLSDITAGKTGTTDGLRDAWFVGYTPDLAVGVWLGTDDGSAVGLTGAQAALPVWAEVMQAAVRRVPPRPFTPPPGIVFASINRETGKLVSFWCGGGPVMEEAFRAGTEPEADCEAPPLTAQARGFLDWFRNLFR